MCMKAIRFCSVIAALFLAAATQAQTEIPLSQGYNYDARIDDDTLFVATDNGIYAYALDKPDAAWKQYAFGGMKILNFCKLGKKIMADYYPQQPQGEYKQALLLLEDYGKTSTDISSETSICMER